MSINALISQNSLPACERLLELCETEYDNPICGVMKAHLLLLANDITNPLLQFKTFNELLDTCVTVEKMAEPERSRVRSFATNAITTFVWVTHMQLECARKKAQKLEDDVLRDVTRKAIAGTKLACKMYCDYQTGGAVSAIESIMADSRALQQQEKRDEPQQTGFIDKIINFFRQEKVVTKSANDFVHVVSNVMEKLDRYSDRIGPSIPIAEMIRDYAGWMYELELSSVHLPLRPSPPKEVKSDFSKALELIKKVLLPVGITVAVCYCFNILLGFALRVLVVTLVIIVPIIAYQLIVECKRIARERVKRQNEMKIYEADLRIFEEKRLPAYEAKKKAVKDRYDSRLEIATKFDA